MHCARVCMRICLCARMYERTPIVWTGITSRSQGNGDRPSLYQKEKGRSDEWGGQSNERREKVSEEGCGDRGGFVRVREREIKQEERERERERERDVTRGITWCIDRCAASTRAIPTYCCQPSYLPQALYHYYPHTPSAVTPSPISLPSPSPRFSLRPLHSLVRLPSSPWNLHSPPTSASATNPLSPPKLVLLPHFSTTLDETPSDIHPRISSELIIKCIIVPAGWPPHPRRISPLFTLTGPCEIFPSLRRHILPRFLLHEKTRFI